MLKAMLYTRLPSKHLMQHTAFLRQ